MDLYEQVVEGTLAQGALGASTIAAVVGAVVPTSAQDDEATLARIGRERERAVAHYLRDREMAGLEATMHRLDAEEVRARQPRTDAGLPADEVVRYLQELPETWAKAQGGTGRQLVADALFERIDVLGLREATAHLSEHAVRHGLAESLPEEFAILVSGRGERSHTAATDLFVPVAWPLQCQVTGQALRRREHLDRDRDGRPAGVGGEDAVRAEDERRGDHQAIGQPQRGSVRRPQRGRGGGDRPTGRLHPRRQRIEEPVHDGDGVGTAPVRRDEALRVRRGRQHQDIAAIPGDADRRDRGRVVCVGGVEQGDDHARVENGQSHSRRSSSSSPGV